MKSKRAKACDIPQSVKNKVWERDGHRCIICGSPVAMPNAHYIPRSKGGLGIEQNIVTLCTELSEYKCHRKFDSGTKEEREELGAEIWNYLKSKYPTLEKENLIYRR